jgi:hypothetical protein
MSRVLVACGPAREAINTKTTTATTNTNATARRIATVDMTILWELRRPAGVVIAAMV